MGIGSSSALGAGLALVGVGIGACSLLLPSEGLSGGGTPSDAGPEGSGLPAPQLVACDDPAFAGDLRCRPIDTLVPGSVGAGPAIDWTGIPVQEIVSGVIEGNQLLVAVHNYDFTGTGGVLSIDLDSGERRLISGTLRTPDGGFINQGSGDGFQDATSLTAAPGSTISVHTWQQFGFVGWILDIDRTTGNRTARQVGGTCSQVLPESLLPQQFRHPALAPDTAAYVMGDSVQGQALIRLIGDQCELLKSLQFGDPGFNPHALTWAEGKIWSTDDNGELLSSIDLKSGSGELVSGPSSIDPSTQIVIGRDDIAVGPSRIFTVGGASEILITEVDRKTGARKAHRADVGPLRLKQRTPQNVWLHPKLDALVLEVDGAIILYDPSTDNANTLSY